MKRLLKILGIGIAACLGLSIIGALINPNKTPSATPVAPMQAATPVALIGQVAAPTLDPTVETTKPETTSAKSTASPTEPIAPMAMSQAISISPKGKSAKVRNGPSTDYAVVTTLSSGQSAVVIGRNTEGNWLQIEQGWVSTIGVTVSGDSSQVAVVNVEAPTVQSALVVASPEPTLASVDAGQAPTAQSTPEIVSPEPTLAAVGAGQAPTVAPAPLVPQPASKCDPAYPDVCIPSPPPDLNCGDLKQFGNIRVVVHPDPHGLDRDGDGFACGGQ